MKRIYKKRRPAAFTLIELLTVIAVIAILVSVVAGGIKAAMNQARNLRQKVEIKAMDTALELFYKDFDDYPESKILPKDGITSGTDLVCGAQILAEALVGRDDRGIEPLARWYPPADENYSKELKDSSTLLESLYKAEDQKSLYRRKGPYVDLKNSGVYTINELWGTNLGTSKIYPSAGATAINRKRSPVITDTFNYNTVEINNKMVKVGQPVLYYKANSAKRFRVDTATPPAVVLNPQRTEYNNWIYDFDDNLPIVQLPVMADSSLEDKDFPDTDKSDGIDKNQAQIFYEKITQTEDADRVFYKPFNSDRFILLSAGRDGIYGTKDDINNFDY